MPVSKQDLRRIVIQRLKKAADADSAQLRSAGLRKQLAPLLQGEPLCIGIYAPLAHEVNLLPLLQEHPQHKYAFPRCESGRRLSFHIVRNTGEDLVPGAMNIMEPAAHTPTITPEEIDLLIVPGVAFTADGRRMGYGGGYYDRFIPQCTKARILALAFEEQIVDDIPTESHDIIMPELIRMR